MMSNSRWIVEIDYASSNGTVTVDHHIEELEEIHNLVERGPDWNSIEQVRIVLNSHRRTSMAMIDEDHA